MSEEQEMEVHESHYDFPHEELMEDLNITTNQLSVALQREIQNFDKKYMDDFIDGNISIQEHDELVVMSYEIAKGIKNEISPRSDNSGMLAGVVTGIFLAVGTFFGIKQITKS